MMVNYKKNCNDHIQGFFCNNNIEWCIEGTRQKWMLSIPLVPPIWLVKLGTKLLKAKIPSLEAVGFQLLQCQVISPRRLFSGEAGIELVRAYLVPSSPNKHPPNSASKVIC